MVWKWTDHFHCKQLALPIILSFFALYAYGEARNEFVFTIKTIEPFPVPRTLSAAFGFLGLAFLFQKKWIALIPFVLGTLIHPLTAGWALPLWCIFHFPKTKIPLICCALFFPLTIFIDIGPLCKSPDDWIKISFGEGLGSQVIYMAAFLIFFLITLKKTESPQSFKKVLHSTSVILGTALYWLIAELSMHHVFLHQVQTFRVQWICQILAVFILVWQSSQLWVFKIQKGLNLEFWEKILLVCLLVLWIDCAYIVPIILLSLLYTIKLGFQKRKTAEIALLVVGLCGAFFAIYQTLDIKPCLKPEYVYAGKALFTGPLFAFISSMVLYFAYRFPKLRPIIALLLILQFVVIVQAQSILPKETFGLAFVLGTLVYITICTQWNSRLVQRGFLMLTSLAMIVCTVLNYDHRDNQLKEKAMNQFVQAPPIPYISNRGKILYSATDFGEAIPPASFPFWRLL